MIDKQLANEEHPRPEDLQLLEDQVNQFNIRATGIDDWQRLAIFVRNEAGEVVAGISGGSWAGYLTVEYLWVSEPLRGQGHGTRLLAAAEREAEARGCTQVFLDTHEFQAIDFYQRLGYEVIGRLEGIGGHHTRFFLRKELG
jgi:GNAT superfamily N-acetyltransferase